VGSQPGEIRLLPAVPEAWPTGRIEGVLARGQIEIDELHWQPGAIHLTMTSEIDQQVTLEAPAAIDSVSSPRNRPAQTEQTDRDDRVRVTMRAGEPVTLRLELRHSV
jgi:alpha-L-fucosidase 2